MTNENQEQAGERQDPAETNRLDTAVETSEQPAEPEAPTYAEPQGVQVAPGASEVNVEVDNSGESEDSSDES